MVRPTSGDAEDGTTKPEAGTTTGYKRAGQAAAVHTWQQTVEGATSPSRGLKQSEEIRGGHYHTTFQSSWRQ